MSVLVNLQRESTEDARQFAYRILKLSILELLLHPGAKLNEAELAQSLAMSRTPIHDILVRLARENLVELIPQRGAFVMCIDSVRVKQAAQMQVQMGIAMLDVIYTKRLKPAYYEPLSKEITKLQFSVATQDYIEAIRCINGFYQALYNLADLELVLSSIQYASADFSRLSLMCCGIDGFCERTLIECRAIVDALVARDNSSACRALQHQFERTYNALPMLRQSHPHFFS